MKLSEQERKILGWLEHRADMPLELLARQSKMKVTTLRYKLSKFKERGLIVNQAPFINVYPLGYSDYTLFFTASSLPQQQYNKLIDKLISADSISWVASLGGEYQIGVAVTARRADEVQKVFSAFGDEYQNIFQQKTVSVRNSFTAFGRKYLLPRTIAGRSFSARMQGKQIEQLDHSDHLLLCALSDAKHVSERDLAKKLNMPVSTISRRLRKLEERSLICGYLYRLNLSALGFAAYRILIHTHGFASDFREKLFKYAEAHPRIVHYIECFGSWDFELGVELEDFAMLSEIIIELHEKFGNYITNVKTLQIFKHLKYSGYPFSKLDI